MKPNRRFHPISCLSILLLGALACGGDGGDGGESFIVSGVWTVNATGSPAPDPSDSSTAGQICSAAAAGAGALPSTQISVAQQDGTVTANEVGSDLAFTGTVNTGGQSFSLISTTPICETQGACSLCGTFFLDFLNAGGDTADVNVNLDLNGNAACPFHCTLTFPTTTAARS